MASASTKGLGGVHCCCLSSRARFGHRSAALRAPCQCRRPRRDDIALQRGGRKRMRRAQSQCSRKQRSTRHAARSQPLTHQPPARKRGAHAQRGEDGARGDWVASSAHRSAPSDEAPGKRRRVSRCCINSSPRVLRPARQARVTPPPAAAAARAAPPGARTSPCAASSPLSGAPRSSRRRGGSARSGAARSGRCRRRGA